ncbi:MAG: VWA domain-containing protein [Chloroflexi bacterium]|nr:VWA domain-containing protein [Chloroflexota bacterium]
MEGRVGPDNMRISGISNRVFAFVFAATILVFASACFGQGGGDDSSLTPIPLVDAPYSPGRFESIARDTTDTFIATALLATNVSEINVDLSDLSEPVQSFLFSIDRLTNQVAVVPAAEEEAARKTGDLLADLRVEILDRGIFDAAGDAITQPVARFAVLYSREVINLVELDDRGAPIPDTSVNLDIEKLRRAGSARSAIIQKTNGGIRAWLKIEVLKSLEPEEPTAVSPRQFTQDRPERSLDVWEGLNEGAVKINVRVRGISPPLAASREPSEDASEKPQQATELEEEPKDEAPDDPLDDPPPNAPDEGIEQDDSEQTGSNANQIPPSNGVPTPTDEIDDTIDPETSEGNKIKPDKEGRPYLYANNIDVMLIIDSSTSTLFDDPFKERFDAAFAYLTTTIQGDLVGAVHFTNDSIVTPLTEIDRNSRKAFRDTIDKVNVPGDNRASGISRALIVSCQELVDHGRAPSRAGILISDGVETELWIPYGVTYPEECYVENGWPIYTIGIGNVRDQAKGEPRLRQLAADTGGEFIPISDLTTLICEVQQLRSRAAGVKSRRCESFDLGQGDSIFHSVIVPPLQVHATFSLNWHSGRIDIQIFRPSDGTRPSYSRATVPDGVERVVGNTNVFYKIPNPEPGTWRVKILRLENKSQDTTTSEAELPAVFGFSSLPVP